METSINKMLNLRIMNFKDPIISAMELLLDLGQANIRWTIILVIKIKYILYRKYPQPVLTSTANKTLPITTLAKFHSISHSLGPRKN